MNVTSLLHFESMKYIGAQTQAASINHHVAAALRVFIEDFYQRIAPAFIVVLSCRRPSPMNFYRNIMQLLYESVDTMIVQLVLVELGRPRRIAGPRTHNLLLVDSLDALLDIEIHTYTAQSDNSEYYFIFLQQRDALIPHDMQGVFAYCWRHQLINCNVMTQSSGGQVLLHTYYPYAAGQCNDSQPTRINRFLGASWQHRDYFPSKLHNLNGCPLVVLARRVSPFLDLDEGQRGLLGLRGLEGRLLQELSHRMNFSIQFAGLQDQLRNRTTWSEKQLLQKLVQERRAHLAIGYVRKRIQYATNLTPVFPHYSNRVVGCLLLNAHNLTSLEIWSFPFQALTWICLLLFASWLIFGLIVRSMYSALLFFILRYHLHQRLPGSLPDLTHGDYAAVMGRTTWQDLREVPSLQDLLGLKSVIVSSEREEEVLRTLDRCTQREGAGSHPLFFGLISQDALLHLTQRGHRAGAYHIIPQDVLEQQLAIYLQKHSHLAAHLDHLVMSIRTVGLLHHWAGQVASERYFRSRFLYREKRIRQPDLWAVYILTAGLYLLSLVVFVCELLATRQAGI
ncbi:uncharacterized protein LOC6525392 [Drosophila yakuba]|uniref:Putative ionotropic receptor ligand binding domain-containing protein n=1 Tax=Drosophila yakuba TaxID=7245 RepID=B4Q0R4_DROYA|nr:uncharacterized protein LOC6525392 [Drosophila yakuba]EDX02335.2 uncharacterized protein Dyak_GE15741 [Drosophila yakuba]